MTREHIVRSFDNDLRQLDTIIAEMGGLAESQLMDAANALQRRDVELAGRIIDDDQKIDALETKIDSLTVQILALRQPMADDLRLVISAVKIGASLERIGDYSKNIAKRTISLADMTPVGGTAMSIGRMARQVQCMIKDVLDAYAARDLAAAEEIRQRDAEVDLLNTSLFRELLTYMMEDPRHITACTHLLFIAKNLERIGDHATNIAEYVQFIVSGELDLEERPKSDESSDTVAAVQDNG
jgi:phosphate transport system protein